MTCKPCSSVEFVFIVYKKQIIMPSLNDIYKLYTCAWPQHEQMLIDSFLSFIKNFIRTSLNRGPGLLLSILGGNTVMLATERPLGVGK